MRRYHVKAYPAGDVEPIEVDTDNLTFVNDDSYGQPHTFGVVGYGTYTLVNLAQVTVLEVTKQ